LSESLNFMLYYLFIVPFRSEVKFVTLKPGQRVTPLETVDVASGPMISRGHHVGMTVTACRSQVVAPTLTRTTVRTPAWPIPFQLPAYVNNLSRSTAASST
jgi:hypothetical protein